MHKPQKGLTAEEFLDFESKSTSKHEYFDGEVFTMSGGTQAHSLISTNIISLLKPKMSGSKCRIHGSDLLVRVDATNSFYYPDATIDCGPYDKKSTFTTTPSVIFEVMSPSTALTDRREKLFSYKRVPSLNAYLIVHQTRKQIRIYRRQEHGWDVEEVGANGSFEIEVCPGTTISIDVADVYDGAELDDSPDLSVQEEEEVYAW